MTPYKTAYLIGLKQPGLVVRVSSPSKLVSLNKDKHLIVWTASGVDFIEIYDALAISTGISTDKINLSIEVSWLTRPTNYITKEKDTIIQVELSKEKLYLRNTKIVIKRNYKRRVIL